MNNQLHKNKHNIKKRKGGTRYLILKYIAANSEAIIDTLINILLWWLVLTITAIALKELIL